MAAESEAADGIRLLTIELKPEHFKAGALDQDLLGYECALAATHAGIDFNLWSPASSELSAGEIDGRPALFMVVTLTPTKLDEPPAQPLRIVGA